MTSVYVFVNIFVESSMMDYVLGALAEIPEVVELYEVTGEFDIISLISCSDIEDFRNILKNKILKIQGIKSTVSAVVLHMHKGAKL
ncbi:MAG: Lrp/AsnC ligand binding domain-containing protein [Nitrososphaerota archaeon]|nr:Lrp/AsnC ligand binding domain-containing protein [Nitrososphaerota archaeon]MDG7034901.1 Lrp/AsnC ligand binding domain-containing protein [Nitrososphaerota archaeon]MDG7035880.1 Lrp/AsnC ligand binding domain-containing protein [Nitrososphaerota archaeon]MDG7038727.1 Lrp/AsnC ligand binding domain-containing protein [Nitrososphaerota archaeon]MDG7039651.1 Lrp/AsnC ligand binding domain-containing protein [Nitrososphaerota archaeon]